MIRSKQMTDSFCWVAFFCFISYSSGSFSDETPRPKWRELAHAPHFKRNAVSDFVEATATVASNVLVQPTKLLELLDAAFNLRMDDNSSPMTVDNLEIRLLRHESPGGVTYGVDCTAEFSSTTFETAPEDLEAHKALYLFVYDETNKDLHISRTYPVFRIIKGQPAAAGVGLGRAGITNPGRYRFAAIVLDIGTSHFPFRFEQLCTMDVEL